MKIHFLRIWFAPLLYVLGTLGISPAVVRAQSPVRIQVVVVEGEGVTSNIHERVAHDPVVKVEDDDHRPVVGAVVVFALPISGTSGEFDNGSTNLTIMTGNDGLATARGLRTNDVPGKLQIYVTATYRGLRARGVINQFVTVAPGSKAPAPALHASKSSGKWKWVLLGVVAAGGAGAAAYFARGGSSTSTPSAVSISTGTVVFGSPH